MRFSGRIAAAAALLAATACNVNVENGAAENEQAQATQQDQQAQDPWADPQAQARARELVAQSNQQQIAQMRQQARSEMQGLRLVVDQSERKLYVYRGDQEVNTFDVAVGTDEHPTPTGDFSFHRVDLNPRWVPPDSEWAEDREPQPPGDPDNPMGRARLVFKMPYTIHGTDNLESLGTAVSHGSIRVANENVVTLAEMLLKAGNSWNGEQWFRQMTESRNEEYQVPLEENVPLTIRE